jgi:exonuclease SbcC
MWTLKHIYAKNLCAFKELKYDLQQRRTTLIFGNNLDNDSQASNGSGKSALIEAIAIGLIGSPLRKVGADEIINDNANEAVVTIVLSNDELCEQMTINRKLSRKQPQEIVVTKQTGPYDTDCDTIVQATVADYNKYILDEIGLTKEEIYANFILSKHKYASFLSSSDKDKKEIINRFSNGVMVDESLAILQADMQPVQAELNVAEGSVAMAQGKVSAIGEQIANELAEATERSQNKANRIEDLKEKIAMKREYIRAQKNMENELNDRLDDLDIVDNKLQKLEKSNKTVIDAQQEINAIFESKGLQPISDYAIKTDSLNKSLQSLLDKSKELGKNFKAKEKELAKIKKGYDDAKEKFSVFEARFGSATSELKEDMQKLKESMNELQAEQTNINKNRQHIERMLASLNGQLAGVISCPKCSHEFTLAGDIDIELVRTQVKQSEAEIAKYEAKFEDNQTRIEDLATEGQNKRKQYDSMVEQKVNMTSNLNVIQIAINNAKAELSAIESEVLETSNNTDKVQNSIERLRLDLFDQSFDILDIEIKKCEAELKNCDMRVQNAEGAIKSFEESIKEIEEASSTDLIDTLKLSKEKYEQELDKAIAHSEEIAAKLASFKTQEATFIEFKTHLANTKINDLSRITNEFLERIGSDIRISFSGYTVLKSGKIRDKISISLIRDGVDCGSFDKFSEGEKARVNLANILAMHKLTNVNCADGKGLDLLVLDEILDATDESGLANIFEALNHLQITSLVVSHGNIAENYPYKLVVNKQNGVSFIND